MPGGPIIDHTAYFKSFCSIAKAYMQAKNILIATGGRAQVPPIEGKEHTIISDQVLDLPKRPDRWVHTSASLALSCVGAYALHCCVDVQLICSQHD